MTAMEYKQENVIIAFALVFGAGSATALGASVVFVPKFVKYATNRKLLASALGMSSGVMIYVSFVEIFQKSRIAFIAADIPENLSYVYATLCFFAGIMIMMILNASVSYFLHHHQHSHSHNHHNHNHHHMPSDVQENVAATAQQQQRRQQQQQNVTTPNTTTTTTTFSDQPILTQQQQAPNIGCCSSDDPIRDLEVLNQMADILIAEEEEAQKHNQQQHQHQYMKPSFIGTTADARVVQGTNESVTNELEDVIQCSIDSNSIHPDIVCNDNVVVEEVQPTNEGIDNNNNMSMVGRSRRSSGSNSSTSTGDEENRYLHDRGMTTIVNNDTAIAGAATTTTNPAATTTAAESNIAQERRLLMQMSVNTAIAIGLHNFPEGLATFVATLHDPNVGAVLAIAIAIHNIPEGLCVALPIYYATGNRRTAFCWAILSGCSEPIAAIVGYIILASTFTSVTYGILFGIVAGMMVIISTRELLPTAHRYDPSDTVVTYSFIFGMSLLALSLVLFVL